MALKKAWEITLVIQQKQYFSIFLTVISLIYCKYTHISFVHDQISPLSTIQTFSIITFSVTHTRTHVDVS